MSEFKVKPGTVEDIAKIVKSWQKSWKESAMEFTASDGDCGLRLPRGEMLNAG